MKLRCYWVFIWINYIGCICYIVLWVHLVVIYCNLRCWLPLLCLPNFGTWNQLFLQCLSWLFILWVKFTKKLICNICKGPPTMTIQESFLSLGFYIAFLNSSICREKEITNPYHKRQSEHMTTKVRHNKVLCNSWASLWLLCLLGFYLGCALVEFVQLPI